MLVTSERKLTRMGDFVGMAPVPVMRGQSARLFESFDLGPHARLWELPVYEVDKAAGGTLARGPYKRRERAGRRAVGVGRRLLGQPGAHEAGPDVLRVRAEVQVVGDDL